MDYVVELYRINGLPFNFRNDIVQSICVRLSDVKRIVAEIENVNPENVSIVSDKRLVLVNGKVIYCYEIIDTVERLIER